MEIKKSTVNVVSSEEIEDALTSPLPKNYLDKLEDGDKGYTNPETEKVKEMFKNADPTNFMYDSDENGNMIIGYKEKEDEYGNIVKEPIIQEKVFSFDDGDLPIEVPLDKSRVFTKDSKGLTPTERNRYEKLKAMNRSTGSPLDEMTLIKKAKNISDLDANIIPEMMVHFVTKKEEESETLNNEERKVIDDFRTQGIMVEPATIEGVKKSLELSRRSRVIHIRDQIVFLTHEGIDLTNMTDDEFNLALQKYKKTRRPSVDLVLEACIEDMTSDRMYEKIRSQAGEENKEEIEAQIKLLKSSPDKRLALIQYYEDNGQHFYDIEDFRKLNTYFRWWGIHDDDAIYFNPSFIPDTHNKATMKMKFEKFKKSTGYSFIDVYKYFRDKISKIKEEEDNRLYQNNISPEFKDMNEDKIQMNSDIVSGVDDNPQTENDLSEFDSFEDFE